MSSQMVGVPSFWWTNNTPLYIYIAFSLFIHRYELKTTTKTNLGCLHIFPVVNSAAINIEVQVSFWYPVFISFWYILRSGSYGSYIFNFLRGIPTVFHSGSTNLRPSSSTQVSPFSTSLSTLGITCLFDNNHSNRCEFLSHCGFDLHFSDD